MAEKNDDKTKEKAKEKPEKPVDDKKEKSKKEIKTAKEKKTKKEELRAADARTVVEAFGVIKFVLMTEKSIRMVESQNKLVFVVNRPSRKKEIKEAVQAAFASPVTDVKTVIDQAGRKKAFVKFKNAGAAGDIAIKLGII